MGSSIKSLKTKGLLCCFIVALCTIAAAGGSIGYLTGLGITKTASLAVLGTAGYVGYQLVTWVPYFLQAAERQPNAAFNVIPQEQDAVERMDIPQMLLRRPLGVTAPAA